MYVYHQDVDITNEYIPTAGVRKKGKLLWQAGKAALSAAVCSLANMIPNAQDSAVCSLANGISRVLLCAHWLMLIHHSEGSNSAFLIPFAG